MAVNEWWREDPSERFWMEITYREDLGGDLLAPQKKRDNRDYWSYDLVTYAVPGDVILHWSAQPELAIVGYSVVKAFAVEDLMNWESPATALKDRVAAGERSAWRLPLAAYRQFAEPVTLEEVRQHEEALRRIQGDLAKRTTGAIYFPFELSDKRPPRPAQGYLVKFPKALLTILPGLSALEELAAAAPVEDVAAPVRTQSRSSRAGRIQDVAKRTAIERYAVDTVTDHFRSSGWQVDDVGNFEPWDLTLTRHGEELHVEVKGSTTPRAGIELTDGEVRHAERTETVLAVVDEIKLADGYSCSGGRLRIWPGWVPDRADLVATSYRYLLPTNAELAVDAIL